MGKFFCLFLSLNIYANCQNGFLKINQLALMAEQVKISEVEVDETTTIVDTNTSTMLLDIYLKRDAPTEIADNILTRIEILYNSSFRNYILNDKEFRRKLQKDGVITFEEGYILDIAERVSSYNASNRYLAMEKLLEDLKLGHKVDNVYTRDIFSELTGLNFTYNYATRSFIRTKSTQKLEFFRHKSIKDLIKEQLKIVKRDPNHLEQDYNQLIEEFRQLEVGEVKGDADRRIIADIMFAKKSPSTNGFPTFATADQYIVKGLLQFKYGQEVGLEKFKLLKSAPDWDLGLIFKKALTIANLEKGTTATAIYIPDFSFIDSLGVSRGINLLYLRDH